MKTYFKFEDLKVWSLANEFCLEVYKILDKFPNFEKYALIDQLRRASISICLNIAEGQAYTSNKISYNYLIRAKGSLYECATCIKLATSLKYIKEEESDLLLLKLKDLEIKLNSLIKYFREKIEQDKIKKEHLSSKI